jgi:hypothetical protein
VIWGLRAGILLQIFRLRRFLNFPIKRTETELVVLGVSAQTEPLHIHHEGCRCTLHYKLKYPCEQPELLFILATNALELSPCSDTDNCSASQENSSTLCNPILHYLVHRSSPLVPILNHMNSVLSSNPLL